MAWFWWGVSWMLWAVAVAIAAEIVGAVISAVGLLLSMLFSKALPTRKKLLAATGSILLMGTVALVQIPAAVASYCCYRASSWCYTPPPPEAIAQHRRALEVHNGWMKRWNAMTDGPRLLTEEESSQWRSDLAACLDAASSVDADALDHYVPGWSNRFKQDYLHGLELQTSKSALESIDGQRRVDSYIDWLNSAHPERQ